MKKRLLAAGLSGMAACLPAVCQADLVIYGRIYAEIASETRGSGAVEQDVNTVDDAQGNGRLGLRFTQRINESLSAFGKYEWQMDAAEGSGFEPRDAYVGLEGAFGSVALGRFTGMYKSTGGTAFDPFVYTGLEARRNGGMSSGPFGTTGFVSRAIEYRMPAWRPLEGMNVNAGVQYLYGDDTTVELDGDAGGYLAGVSIEYGVFEFIAAASHDDFSDANNVKFGVRLREGNLTYLLQTEDVETGGYDPTGAGSFILGGVQYRAGDVLYALQVGDYNSDLDDASAGYYAIGVHYSLARNIWLTGGYRNTDSDLDILGSSAVVLGMRYDF